MDCRTGQPHSRQVVAGGGPTLAEPRAGNQAVDSIFPRDRDNLCVVFSSRFSISKVDPDSALLARNLGGTSAPVCFFVKQKLNPGDFHEETYSFNHSVGSVLAKRGGDSRRRQYEQSTEWDKPKALLYRQLLF